eukprot:jgi/Chrzof1/2511/Cz11g18100.t1
MFTKHRIIIVAPAIGQSAMWFAAHIHGNSVCDKHKNGIPCNVVCKDAAAAAAAAAGSVILPKSHPRHQQEMHNIASFHVLIAGSQIIAVLAGSLQQIPA